MRSHFAVALLSIAGCAVTPPSAPSRVGWYLPPSLPAGYRAGAGVAGESASVVIDPEREAVRSLVGRYVSLLLSGTVEGMSPLFADVVGGVQSPSPRPLGAASRATVLLRHERLLLPLLQGAQLLRGARVRSFAECSAERCAAEAMRPGDWYADWSLAEQRWGNSRPPRAAGHFVPQAVIVRWDDASDEPRIAGVTDGLLARPLP